MNEEHVKVVRQGAEAIRVWREANPKAQLNLRKVNLSGFNLLNTNLSNADLTHASLMGVNLASADLSYATLNFANLREADLKRVVLNQAELNHANLKFADLDFANLYYAEMNNAVLVATGLQHTILYGARLRGADMENAHLNNANLNSAELSSAELSNADMRGANLSDAVLNSANLSNARISGTIFSDVDLSETLGLDKVNHEGPSPVSTSTLRLSKGRIPDVFLRGCGLQPWEILHAKLYDPLLTREQKAEIHNEVFQKMVGPPIGGVFISYSHENMEFIDKLHEKLDEKEYSVWRDVHGLVAGPMERQVFDAIRAHDVVLLVLSEASVNSDWVELELEKAVAKEKEEGRPVLCPVALDDSWKAKLKQSGSQVLWRKVKEKNVLDFSGDFEEPFQKLLAGMARYYGSEAQGS